MAPKISPRRQNLGGSDVHDQEVKCRQNGHGDTRGGTDKIVKNNLLLFLVFK
jgi:hypothetical protein